MKLNPSYKLIAAQLVKKHPILWTRWFVTIKRSTLLGESSPQPHILLKTRFNIILCSFPSFYCLRLEKYMNSTSSHALVRNKESAAKT
jgi:hypothetical protein